MWAKCPPSIHSGYLETNIKFLAFLQDYGVIHDYFQVHVKMFPGKKSEAPEP